MMATQTETSTAKNLSFVLEGVQKVKFEDRPIPELKGPRDVLVQVKYTGICGSDVHYWDEGKLGSMEIKDPMVLGHESAGVVAKIGDGVKNLKVGDEVAMEPGIPCRFCDRCKEGRYNLCPEMAFAATPPINGTLARFYSLPEDFCYKLPEHVSLQEGALMEPLSVAIHITKQGNIRPGMSVIVFGAGPVGLLCCAVAKAYGVSKIVSVDIQQNRLDFAKKYLALETFVSEKVQATENAARLIKEKNLGDGADVVIDASGVEPSMQAGIHALRMGGTYVQGGMGKPDAVFPIGAACAKELTVKGSFRYNSGDYALAIDLVSRGVINVMDLITGRVPFEEAEQAFKDVKAGKGIKTLIEGQKSCQSPKLSVD